MSSWSDSKLLPAVISSLSSHTVSMSVYSIKLIPVISYSESLFIFPHPVKLITSANADMIIMLLCFIDSSIFCLLPSYQINITQTYEQIHIISACRQHRVLWHTLTPPVGILHCMGRSDGKRNRQDITGHILMAHQWQVRLMCTIRSGSGL